MVAGGLAGASPHMISATVTAISRLVFEFKGLFIHLITSKRTDQDSTRYHEPKYAH